MISQVEFHLVANLYYVICVYNGTKKYLCDNIFSLWYKVAKSHGLPVRLTDIYLFSQSHDRSCFSHGFLRGSPSFFRSNTSVIQKFFWWLSCSMLNTFHSTTLFVITTCQDMLHNPQRPPHMPGMRSSVFIWVLFKFQDGVAE